MRNTKLSHLCVLVSLLYIAAFVSFISYLVVAQSVIRTIALAVWVGKYHHKDNVLVVCEEYMYSE